MARIIFECSGGMLDQDRDLTVNLDNLPNGEAHTLLNELSARMGATLV